MRASLWRQKPLLQFSSVILKLMSQVVFILSFLFRYLSFPPVVFLIARLEQPKYKRVTKYIWQAILGLWKLLTNFAIKLN